MEDFIQKQDDALFQEIDNHLIEVYYGRSLEYPSFDKFLIALDRAHQYPTERNRTKFNKLHRVLLNLCLKGYSTQSNKNEPIKFNSSANTSLYIGYYIFDMLPGNRHLPAFNEIWDLVISINYFMYDDITLEKYLNIDEGGETRSDEEKELNFKKERDTSFQRLKQGLDFLEFFELPKIINLQDEQKDLLLQLIHSEKAPFNIALFKSLGFIDHIEKAKFNSRGSMYEGLAKLLIVHRDQIKNNLNSLNINSKVDKLRYTAHLHEKNAEDLYYQIKENRYK